MKKSLYTALFVGFIDYMGIGLIYPLFSAMLFDTSIPLLPLQTTNEMRGFWLGLLIALMPLSQFFSSPFWGALSDSKGRKKPLLISLIIGILGYATALCGIFFYNIAILLLSRIMIGFASGNMSIVQATIADLSSSEEKVKNFGLYSMALGAGFTLGPFFGGFLSSWDYTLPFFFAVTIMALNFLFAFFLFKETHHLTFERKLSWHIGLSHLKKAFHSRGIRSILLVSFLHNFAWSYFFEFIPLYLMSELQFSPSNLGIFYGVSGGFYALSAGLLIRPFIYKFKPETLFFGGNFFAAWTILALIFIPASLWIWPLMGLICFFVSFITPASSTLISNNTTGQVQGESLGVLSSVNAAALVISPVFSGSLIAAYPVLSMWVGGSVMLFSAFIMLAVFRHRLFRLR